jgi:hypothetical protein
VAWKALTTFGLLLVLVLAACGDPEAIQRQQTAAIEARGVTLEAALRKFNAQPREDDSGLLIQLAFGAEADLDLYVTDPLLETVYFANKKGKSGGEISADHRCDSQALRVEEVRFEAPLSGAYRIGVDYPRRCDGARTMEFEQRAAYALSVLHNGERRNITGAVGYQFFEVAAFDFTIDGLDTGELGNE